MSTTPFTILSQRQCGLVRSVLTPTGGAKLQAFSLGESTQVELEPDELQAFLRTLPMEVLNDALKSALVASPNLFFELDGSRNGQHC